MAKKLQIMGEIPVELSEELIRSIIAEYMKENPSGDVPNVTKEDDGKIMIVSGGKWVADELPKYEGVYSVTPSASGDTILLTAQKMMDANVTVSKIPYSEVSNSSDGTTVTIG